MIPSTKETLTRKRLKDIFLLQPLRKEEPPGDPAYFLPMCQQPENIQKLQHSEIDYNTPEKEFASITEKELNEIGIFLANQLKEGVIYKQNFFENLKKNLASQRFYVLLLGYILESERK